MTRRARLAAAVVLVVCALWQACATGGRVPEADRVPEGWPVDPQRAVVTSSFGAPRGRGTHQGIDLAAPKGTSVRATAAGRVVFAGRSGRFGRLVVIDHGAGWETRYAHLRTIDAKTGRVVSRGQRVGTVGRSGNASGFHLHYEVRRHDVALDPRPMMDAR